MQSAIPNPELRQNRVLDWLKSNTGLVVVFLILLAFRFVVAPLDGQSFSAVLANETGNAKFLQGLMIEVFILAVYAIRENEDRALMLGYNTFTFKLVVLIISSITAALAGGLHTIHQPIVSPNIAGLAFTVAALLIILIGGIGTLTGAYVGAAVFRLLQFYLDKWFGEISSFLIGLIYVLLVLFIPYGIVGTWRVHSFRAKQGRQYLARLLSGGLYQSEAEMEGEELENKLSSDAEEEPD